MASRNLGVRCCARCSAPLPRNRLFYSRHLRRYVCRDTGACQARIKQIGQTPIVRPTDPIAQACRDCGTPFPFNPTADRCPVCVAELLGAVA